MSSLPDDALIARAAAALLRGELVAFPTETVYGLGARADDAEAVGRIFRAKGRPADHPLIVHLPELAHLERWAARVPATARALAAAFWPGPLTLIVRRGPRVLPVVTGGQDTVGLRMPAHPVAVALLEAAGVGVAAPSANRFGRISPTTAAHVQQELGDAVSVIIDGGPCARGLESTIVDLSRDDQVRILRPGPITAAEIEAIIAMPVQRHAGPAPGTAVDTQATRDPADVITRAPGTLLAHYAPRRPLRLVEPAELVPQLREAGGAARTVAVLAYQAPAAPVPANVVWLGMPRDPAEYGTHLYARLREADQDAVVEILVEMPPGGDAWEAVWDRLRRAAHGSQG